MNSDIPRLSVVMPSFNQVEFIERSILSIINQKYPNLQLIIIDGGSSDGTLDIIEKYKSHIDYFISEADNGQSDALNKGFKVADGDIFGWLNSDDIYLPGSVKVAIDALQKHKNKSIVFGDWLSIDENDQAIDHHFAFDFSVNHFKYEGFHLNAQSMFWQKETHERFSGFIVSLYNTMDYQMILEFGINEGDDFFLRIPVNIGAFRRYNGQKTAGITDIVINEHKYLAQHYLYMDKYESLGSVKRLFFRFRRAYWYLKRGGFKELMNRVKMSYFKS